MAKLARSNKFWLGLLALFASWSSQYDARLEGAEFVKSYGFTADCFRFSSNTLTVTEHSCCSEETYQGCYIRMGDSVLLLSVACTGWFRLTQDGREMSTPMFIGVMMKEDGWLSLARRNG